MRGGTLRQPTVAGVPCVQDLERQLAAPAARAAAADLQRQVAADLTRPARADKAPPAARAS